jgi:hypothetical protein
MKPPKTIKARVRMSPPGACDAIRTVFDRYTIGRNQPDRATVERECIKLGIHIPTIHTQYCVNVNRLKRQRI